MKKVWFLIGSLILVFCCSGCTIGRLDEIPPKAIDEEYVVDSFNKGSRIAELTLEYIDNVLIELGIKVPNQVEIEEKIDEVLPNKSEVMDKVDDVSENLPTVADINENVTDKLPTGGEIKDKVWEVSEKLDKKFQEIVE